MSEDHQPSLTLSESTISPTLKSKRKKTSNRSEKRKRRNAKVNHRKKSLDKEEGSVIYEREINLTHDGEKTSETSDSDEPDNQKRCCHMDFGDSDTFCVSCPKKIAEGMDCVCENLFYLLEEHINNGRAILEQALNQEHDYFTKYSLCGKLDCFEAHSSILEEELTQLTGLYQQFCTKISESTNKAIGLSK